MLGDFGDISNDAGWFDFMESTFPEVVVPTEYYNGNNLEQEHLLFLESGSVPRRGVSFRK